MHIVMTGESGMVSECAWCNYWLRMWGGGTKTDTRTLRYYMHVAQQNVEMQYIVNNHYGMAIPPVCNQSFSLTASCPDLISSLGMALPAKLETRQHLHSEP